MDDIANVFTYFAGLADKDGGEMINSPIPNTESKVVKEPVGVVTQITPGTIHYFKPHGRSHQH